MRTIYEDADGDVTLPDNGNDGQSPVEHSRSNRHQWPFPRRGHAGTTSFCSGISPVGASRSPAPAGGSGTASTGATAHAGNPCGSDSPAAATDNAAWPRPERSARPSDGNTDHTHGRGRPRIRPPTASRSLARMPTGYFWSCHPTLTSSRSSEPTCCTGYTAVPSDSGCRDAAFASGTNAGLYPRNQSGSIRSN